MSEAVIEVAALGYTYEGSERPALEEVEFQVDRGEIFGFLGPNGAGKSTTQKILIGLLRDYGGDVRLLGRPLSEWTSDFYEHIGGRQIRGCSTTLQQIPNQSSYLRL